MTEGLKIPTPALLIALYREHERALRAYLRARIRSSESVEDLCQEVFLAALARGVPEGDCGPWLFAIARNKVLKHARDRKESSALSPGLPGSAETPAHAASEAEERERVRRAVAELEPELREAVFLKSVARPGSRTSRTRSETSRAAVETSRRGARSRPGA